MMWWRIAAMFFLSGVVFGAAAQPMLPDIAGSADKGIVILSWVCQYNGIKDVTVMHSSDSVTYAAIGHVKKTAKGVQAFVDGHPSAGKNYYKLSLVFSTGLKWTSNRCSVVVDRKAVVAPTALPGNDSLQRYIVTDEVFSPALPDSLAGSILKTEKSRQHSVRSDSQKHVMPRVKPAFDTAVNADAYLDNGTKHKISVSIELDSTGKAGNAGVAHPRKKITVFFQEPDTTAVGIVRSRFIFTDAMSGHVNMNLPDDVKSHHYSVKFFDAHNVMIIDVPHINADHIIIDRRNFQHTGVYRFVLRRDVTELETGYIRIEE